MTLPDVVVIGAGMVGAACAYYASRAGLAVTVLDRGPIAGGTTAAGVGNLMVSDKPPGPYLDLAVYSLRRWEELGGELGAATIELVRKGGLAVAAAASELAALAHVSGRQRSAGVDVVEVTPDELPGYEPLIARNLAGGVFYPQDMHVHPALATAHLLRASGARVRCGVDVRGVDLDPGMRVIGVRLAGGDRIACGAVVNSAGVWAGDLAAMTGTPLPVTPRRGLVLVTEPVGAPRDGSRAPAGDQPVVRHTVYGTGYAATVDSDDLAPGASTVVVATRAGTVLIGASREQVGFDRSWPLPILRRLAAQAVALLPFLAQVSALRAYRGFRPATPDHLPVIGPDPWIGGLYHACGHGGSGIALAPATGALIARMLTAAPAPVPASNSAAGSTSATDDWPVDPFPFHPERFGSGWAR
ncbi:MAG TPA: FAD-dependent oxidoreductase [Pilimelia sp.]|nr:FAD-dependent oxidoreductase [Pilimelia sp.]